MELIGKRWTGAIVYVLMESRKPMRFSEVGQAVPELSDRLLSERMKELETRGIVERQVHNESPVRVEYELTGMGRELGPALRELRDGHRAACHLVTDEGNPPEVLTLGATRVHD